MLYIIINNRCALPEPTFLTSHNGFFYRSMIAVNVGITHRNLGEQKMKNGKLAMALEKIKSLWCLEGQKPLQITVMGQTGVGKSSLLNALFGTKFKVSSTRPETLEPQPHIEDMGDHKLEFWDLPGLGEARVADERYSNAYRERLLSSHVVI